MYEFKPTKNFNEDNCILYLVPDRKNRPKDFKTCPLCEAIQVEPKTEYKNLFLMNTKYPDVEESRLLVSNQCYAIPTQKDFLSLFEYLSNKPNIVGFCNMLNSPSIPNHWHIEITNASNLPDFFVEYWLKAIANKDKYNNIGLNLVKNDHGTFYVRQLKNKTAISKAIILKRIYNFILSRKSKAHLAVSNDLIIICFIGEFPKLVSISAKSVFGYFTCSTPEKFEYMKKLGISNLLAKYSRHI